MKKTEEKKMVAGVEFPAGPVEWIEYCRGLDVPPEKLWAALVADCKPLPPGHASVVLAVWQAEREMREPLNLTGMLKRLGRKISGSTVEAIEDKGWIVRQGLERGAGWKVKRDKVELVKDILGRVETRRVKVWGRVNQTMQPTQ
jgi:hypothetical protein